MGMKQKIRIVLVLAGCLAGAPWLWTQGQSDKAQKSAGDRQKSNGQPTPQPNSQENANPFPGDTSNVPVMPSRATPDVPRNEPDKAEGARYPLPNGDPDPVPSPDDTGGAAGNAQEQESSSDVKGLDSILPPPGEDQGGKRGKNQYDVLAGPPKESSKEDINVGQYYLDNKNWRAALSRFQSALVLAPDEPEVYWGLAESERHLGDFASARANYQKVIEYDPDSKHAKEAKKALKDPEIANAKAAPPGQGTQTPQ